MFNTSTQCDDTCENITPQESDNSRENIPVHISAISTADPYKLLILLD